MSSNSSGFKFDMHIGKKPRVAHREVPTTFLQDLAHKKQSITQALSKNSSPKKKTAATKQSSLISFLQMSKPQKMLRKETLKGFINDQKLEENSNPSDDSDDDDDLAVGGSSSTKLFDKKPHHMTDFKSEKAFLATIAEVEANSKANGRILPPSPPHDYMAPLKIPQLPKNIMAINKNLPIGQKHRKPAVHSSDEEEEGKATGSKDNKTNNSSGKRKAVIISDDEDDVNVKEINKNIKILMSSCDQEDEDEGEWLSKANAPKPKKKEKEKKMTLKAMKKKAEKLRKKNKGKRDDEDDEFSGGDSDDPMDGEMHEDDVDSDDSDASQRLTAKEQKKIRALEQKCLEFVNGASPEELAENEKFNERFVKFILETRPFQDYKDLKEKVSAKKGQNLMMLRCLDNYLEWLENRGVLEQVLDDCREFSKSIERALEQMQVERKPVEHPPGLNPQYSLHAYQQIGLNWLIMMHNLGMDAILADEMGLGKTIQVIAFFAWAKSQSKIRGPHLIVVPSSTIENWIQEITRWAPDLRLLTYYGSIEERQQLRNSARKHEVDLILTTYNMVISRAEDRKFFKKFSLNYVCYDEGHMLRNCATQRYTNLIRIRGKRKILLTGTPLQNNLVELISLLYFTMHHLFDKYCQDINSLLSLFTVKGKMLMDQKGGSEGSTKAKTKKRRATNDEEEEAEIVAGNEEEEGKDAGNTANSLYQKHKIAQAKSILQPFVLRRLKTDVLNNLPTKHEHTEYCEPTTVQANLYAEFLNSIQERRDLHGIGIGGTEFVMQLRQIANHPLLYRRNFDDEKVTAIANILVENVKAYEKKRADYLAETLAYELDIGLHLLCQKHEEHLGAFLLDPELALESGKFKVLDRLLPEIIEQKNEKVLIFSQFTSLLNILEIYLCFREYNFVRLDGSTPVMERQELINLFNKDPSIPIFLISTKAGGLGINLTAANHIIIHDIDMNPYNDKQAEDRCHRIGQTKEVHITRLICKDSIEEQMLALAKRKLELERDVTARGEGSDAHGENSKSSSKKSVEELLRNLLQETAQRSPTTSTVPKKKNV